MLKFKKLDDQDFNGVEIEFYFKNFERISVTFLGY